MNLQYSNIIKNLNLKSFGAIIRIPSKDAE